MFFEKFKRPINNSELDSQKAETAVENQAEQTSDAETLEHEIKAMLSVLQPDNQTDDTFANLFDDVKKIQLHENRLVVAPLESLKEMKEVLRSRLHQLIDDVSNNRHNQNLDHNSIKKAKIALLTDADPYGVNPYTKTPVDNWDLDNFFNYLRPSIFTKEEVDVRLSAQDIDQLLQTPYRDNVLRGSLHHFYAKGERLQEVSDNLLIALSQSERQDINFYYILNQALERATPGQYSQETLQHAVAAGHNRLCLKFFDKFKGDQLEGILNMGGLDATDALEAINKAPAEKRQEYLLTFLRCNRFGLRQSDKNPEFKEYTETVENIHDLSSETEKLAAVKDLVRQGYLGKILAYWDDRELLERNLSNDYESIRDAAVAHGQEHLIFDSLHPEDQSVYCQKLLDSGEAYKLPPLLKNASTGKGVLDDNFFKAFQASGFSEHLHGNFSNFKDLSGDNATSLLEKGHFNDLIKNFSSFNLSEEFLHSSQLQDIALEQFSEKFNFFQSNEARTIFDKIPLPRASVEKIFLEKVSCLLQDMRGATSTVLVNQFSEFRDLLDNQEFYSLVNNNLENQDSLEDVIKILQTFPLPKETLTDPNLVAQLTSLADKYFKDVKSFNWARTTYRNVKQLSKFIELPAEMMTKGALIDAIENLASEDFDVRLDIFKKIVAVSNPDEALARYQELLAEFRDFGNQGLVLDQNLALFYLDNFFSNDNPADKQKFVEQVKADTVSLAHNQSLVESDPNYYTAIVKTVYPQRNYNAYANLEEYQDLSSHLDKYKFNRAGYTLKLSGILGYRIKEGEKTDDALLAEYQKRMANVKSLTQAERLDTFLEESLDGGEAQTLEGKILEYFRQHGYNADTIDVLLAYQLKETYVDFAANSVDRLEAETNQVSKDYILLDELANQYGDNLKETIRLVQQKVFASEDKDLFAINLFTAHEKKYQEALEIISSDLKKIPEDKLNSEIIKKKVVKTIKNIFQNIPEVAQRAEKLSSLLPLDNLDELENAWLPKMQELFDSDQVSGIDLSKVESLQSNVFNIIQGELNKYEEVKEYDEERGEAKLKKDRTIKGYFSKNKENALARMVGDVCLATDADMLKNEDYFEFVLFDEDKNKCVGTTMLMSMDEGKGEKYLLYGPNPAVGLVSEVSSKKLYQLLTKQISQFAKDNNFTGVLVDKTHGRSTNRAGLFQQTLEQSCLKDQNNQELVFNLKKSYLLGGHYSYQDNLRAVYLQDK